MQSTCEQCGTAFTSRPRNKGRFCSRECHRQWQKDNAYALKVCANCGKEFKSPTTVKADCCSANCRKQYTNVTCNCITCGKEFTKVRSNPKKYCSHKCYAANHVPDTKLPPMYCEVCGNEIIKNRKRGKRFCSQKCFGQWKTTVTGEDHPMFAKLECTCEQCGKMFLAQRSHVLQGRARYCSRKCRNESGQAEYTCKHCENVFTSCKSHQKSNRRQFCNRECQRAYYATFCTCEQCHKEFRTKRFKENTARFCSIACKSQWQSENMCGEDSPSWKGGYKRYYGPNWYRQRNRARKRDKYKCQHCGVHEKKLSRQLDVHHLRSFREFGYIPGENDFFKLANALPNLISLCPSCHAKVEHNQVPIQPYLL